MKNIFDFACELKEIIDRKIVSCAFKKKVGREKITVISLERFVYIIKVIL